jgi:hypothetical protein
VAQTLDGLLRLPSVGRVPTLSQESTAVPALVPASSLQLEVAVFGTESEVTNGTEIVRHRVDRGSAPISQVNGEAWAPRWNLERRFQVPNSGFDVSLIGQFI